MTIAELHGKVSGEGTNLNERLEDLLTSDVFGALLYAEAWDVLYRWLEHAINASVVSEGFWKVFPECRSIKSARMIFWPPPGRLRREPDVVIRLETNQDGKPGPALGICVEAKYLSGKSNRSTDKTESVDETHLAGASSDQLAEEWLQIYPDNPPPPYKWEGVQREQRALVYVTAHPEWPDPDIQQSLDRLPNCDRATRQRWFWLGWCHLYQVLEEWFRDVQGGKAPCSGRALLLYDLLKLLERKRLRAFRGFRECIGGPMGLAATRGEPCFWTDRFFEFLKAEDEVVFEPPIFWRESNE